MKIVGAKPYFGGSKNIEEITHDIKQILNSFGPIDHIKANLNHMKGGRKADISNNLNI